MRSRCLHNGIIPTALLVLVFSVQTSFSGGAPVTVGTTGAAYSTIKSAFDAINNGTLTGAVVLEIIDNTVETATARLNKSGAGAADYSSVTMYPTHSGTVVSGNVAGPLVELNGACNVVMDGRPNMLGSSYGISYVNGSTSNAGGTSTIRLVNGACDNIIMYSLIRGSGTCDTSGVLLFDGSNSAAGNSNNLITKDLFTLAGTSRPVHVVYSRGNDTHPNVTNGFTDNQVFDILAVDAGVASTAVLLADNNADWGISGNSFYQTIPLQPVSSMPYHIIEIGYVNNPGTHFTVSGNFIGGSLPRCGGGMWDKRSTASNEFVGISIRVGASSGSAVTGNVITNLQWANSSDDQFLGIGCEGDVQIGTGGGNVIGDSAGSGSILLTTGGSEAIIRGIWYEGIAVDLDISNNVIGGMIVSSPDESTTNRYVGISVSGNDGITTIHDNTIGSTTEPSSIVLEGHATGDMSQIMSGIRTFVEGELHITGNTIAGLRNRTIATDEARYGYVHGIHAIGAYRTITNNVIHTLRTENVTVLGGIQSAVLGIGVDHPDNGGGRIAGNTIYDLRNDHPDHAGTIAGIWLNRPAASPDTIDANFIHDLRFNEADSLGTGYGIGMDASAALLSNNLVVLGDVAPVTLYGVYQAGVVTCPTALYFNTVFLGGEQQEGASARSYALFSALPDGSRDFRNNVFVNTRSTDNGAPAHFAAYFDYAPSGDLTLDHNDYHVSGTGGMLGGSNGVGQAALPIVPGKDGSSTTDDPAFANAGGPAVMDYKPATHLLGIAGTGITVDHAGSARPGVPTMGALECSDVLPAQLASFTASMVGTAGVRLAWRTISEVNNYGFTVERNLPASNIWNSIGFVPGSGTTIVPHDYTFTDPDLQAGTSYRLKQTDLDNTVHYSDPVRVGSVTDVREDKPTALRLDQNFPNPFNPTTTVRYAVPEASMVRVTVTDVLGREIAELVNDRKEPGVHEVQFNASGLASGVYIYQLCVGSSIMTKRLLLLK